MIYTLVVWTISHTILVLLTYVVEFGQIN